MRVYPKPKRDVIIAQSLEIQADRDRLRERCRKLEEALQRIAKVADEQGHSKTQCKCIYCHARRALLNETA